MTRTPAQVAADEALRAAVDEHRRAYDHVPGAMLMDFVVVGSTVSYDDDGTADYRIFTDHAEDAIPLHRVVGLLDLAAHHTRRASEGE